MTRELSLGFFGDEVGRVYLASRCIRRGGVVGVGCLGRCSEPELNRVVDSTDTGELIGMPPEDFLELSEALEPFLKRRMLRLSDLELVRLSVSQRKWLPVLEREQT